MADVSGTKADLPTRVNEISHEIIGAAMTVHSALGAGLRERLYGVSLLHELRSRGLDVETQVQFVSEYKGVRLPVQNIDTIVENTVIIELKSVRSLTDEDHAQLLGYLRFTGRPLGLLLNFACAHLRDGIHRKINFPPAQSNVSIISRTPSVPSVLPS